MTRRLSTEEYDVASKTDEELIAAIPTGYSFIELTEYSPRQKLKVRVDAIVSWRQRWNGGIADGSVVEYVVGQEARTVEVIEQPSTLEKRMVEAASLADVVSH